MAGFGPSLTRRAASAGLLRHGRDPSHLLAIPWIASGSSSPVLLSCRYRVSWRRRPFDGDRDSLEPTHIRRPRETPATKTTPPESPIHVPVMVSEVLRLWVPPAEDRSGGSPLHLVDGTAGGGGHSSAALMLRPSVRLLAIDRDESILGGCRTRLAAYIGSHGAAVRDSGVSFYRGSFADVGAAIRETDLFPDRVDGIFVDLGSNTEQLDDAGRGMSYRRDGPLDMRFDRGRRTADKGDDCDSDGDGTNATAAAATTTKQAGDLVNGMSAEDLASLFRTSDETHADIIAEAIVRWRKRDSGAAGGGGQRRGRKRPIRSTMELRYLIEKAMDEHAPDNESRPRPGFDPSPIWLPDRKGRFASRARRKKLLGRYEESRPRHTNTLMRIFQALRIEVNGELDHIRNFLSEAPRFLREGGRLVVISYQPGEDEIVAEAMRSLCEVSNGDVAEIFDDDYESRRLFFENLTEEPIRPSRGELRANGRARSAHLRAVMRTAHPDRT